MNAARTWLLEGLATPQKLYHDAYDRGWLPTRALGVGVVSVGALTVGGAGKTPLTELVVRHLQAVGRTVAIVSRGYGRRSRGTTVVSAGQGPLVPVMTAGDEPWLLARRTSATVVVGGDRFAAAERAVALGADVVVLDDAFQHRRLRRDVDIVSVDGRPARPAFALPFGPGREPPSALARADLVVAVHGPQAGSDFAPTLRSSPEREVHVQVRAEAWTDLHGRPTSQPAQAWLLSAIARPHRFAATVEATGTRVVGHTRFRDHRWLSRRDVARVAGYAAQAGADRVVTTEKDAVRWPSRVPAPVVLPIRLEIISGRSFFDEALRALP